MSLARASVSDRGRRTAGDASPIIESWTAVRRELTSGWQPHGTVTSQESFQMLVGLAEAEHICYVADTRGDTVSTAYEQYRAQRLADPKFKALYTQKRAEIDLIDTILSHIEHRREELGLSKADLARLVGVRPEAVRRLLSAQSSNPTLFTVTKLASVLGMQIDIKPTVSATKLGPRVRKVAKELATAVG